MQSELIERTSRMYDSIVEDVIKKLTDQSANGMLQMSESEIIQLKSIWVRKLDELRKETKIEDIENLKQSSFIKPKPRYKEQIEEYEEIHKKVKIEQFHNVKQEQKIEMVQPDIEDGQEIVEFEDDEPEPQQDQNNKVFVLSSSLDQQMKIEQNNHESSSNISQYPTIPRTQKKNDKTIFDLIKARQNQIENDQRDKDSNHEDSDKDDKDDKDEEEEYSLNIFAQKINKTEAALSRIKPNKTQKAYLENVLFQDANKDQFISSATVNFNFKTEQKK